MTDVAMDARVWLSHEIDALTGCIERLRAIDNPAVNQEAKAEQVRRMEREVEVFRWLLTLAENAP